jgi:hypothetical protein
MEIRALRSGWVHVGMLLAVDSIPT